jgi:hypothetical protein
MRKIKKQSLKSLQQELLEIVERKYAEKDNEIKTCIEKINHKYEEMQTKLQARKEKQLSLGQKSKNILVNLSLKTLQICDKLIVLQKISNQIMEYNRDDILIFAEKEIKNAIRKIDGQPYVK